MSWSPYLFFNDSLPIVAALGMGEELSLHFIVGSDQDLEFDLGTLDSLSRLGLTLCVILTWRLFVVVWSCFALFEARFCFVWQGTM